MNDAMPVSAPILWLLVLLGYLLGSIPFGYLLVRARSGGDVRAMGSGNIGAANVARTAGFSIGVATLVLDAAKGFFAVWLAGHFSDGNIRFMMYAGLAAILGHVFPVWLKFSGGKGVATALGVFLMISWGGVAAAVVIALDQLSAKSGGGRAGCRTTCAARSTSVTRTSRHVRLRRCLICRTTSRRPEPPRQTTTAPATGWSRRGSCRFRRNGRRPPRRPRRSTWPARP